MKKLTESAQKLSQEDNIVMNVKVSQIHGKEQYIATANVSTFNPEKFIPNGGPVTKKSVTVEALGKDYDAAYNAVLDRAVELLGL